MDVDEYYGKIDPMAAVNAVAATLRKIDSRLVDHGERVAFISCAFHKACGLSLPCKQLFILSLFHDIGAYKTDEIDRMVAFETNEALNHSVYGYLFLKYMTPLSDCSEAILYHHTPWRELMKKETNCREYAALIFLADRIDICIQHGYDDNALKKLLKNDDKLFNGVYKDVVCSLNLDKEIIKPISDGSYKLINAGYMNDFKPTISETVEYLKMLVYSIDFRSEQTVTHTINTISLALDIAKHFGLDGDTQKRIYLGALLHDVGKVSIPEEILECTGRLTEEQMNIMRTHVSETENIIKEIVPADICKIASRHHEKLDGSGYPNGLSANELSFTERIVAVADITSALCGRRSYKEPLPKEKTIEILRDMSTSKLDPDICDYVTTNYTDIISRTEGARNEIVLKYHQIMSEFAILTK